MMAERGQQMAPSHIKHNWFHNHEINNIIFSPASNKTLQEIITGFIYLVEDI